MKRFSLILLLMTLLCLPFARAEDAAAPTVNDMGLELSGNAVRYPQVTGLADETVQQKVNEALMAAGEIESRLNRMAMLISSPVKMNVSYTCTLSGDVLTCVFLADGAVETTRSTQVYSAVTIDLRNGDIIPFDALFADASAAREGIAAYIGSEVLPELSAHVEADLTALPETFSASPTALTLYYPIESYRTLNDRAGTLVIPWGELLPWLDLSAGSFLGRAGVTTHTAFAGDVREALALTLADGALPGIPAALGDGVQPLLDAHGELTDPDLYAGGRLVALDGGAFRGVWLMTDALTESFEHSVVQGIRTDSIALHGLMTGVTTIEQWRSALGEAENTLTVDAENAESWRIQPGVSDYYTLGRVRIRLHADESGVLRTVFLTQAP